MNISMSKNTEAIDITKFSQQFYEINNTKICSDTRDEFTNNGLFIIKNNNW